MREENYFKVKLETLKETLTFAKSKLDHLDVQMKVLIVRFDHDKKVYNDQTIHMQETVSSMEKRIPELEKKLKQGYTTIDLRTGKAYKSFAERHKGLLKDKVKKLEEQEKIVAEKYAQREALKNKKRSRLTPIELDVIAAQEVREEAQPADELKEVQEKEIERLKLKEEFYRTELEKLKTVKKIEPKEVKFDSVGNEVIKELLEELTPPEEIPVPKDDHEGKAQCPECQQYFTKGGAFAAHYKSHFNGD